MNEPLLLNATELMAILGLGKSRFHVLRKRGAFDHLMTKRPLGHRRYSKRLVELYVNGESTVRMGEGMRGL